MDTKRALQIVVDKIWISTCIISPMRWSEYPNLPNFANRSISFPSSLLTLGDQLREHHTGELLIQSSLLSINLLKISTKQTVLPLKAAIATNVVICRMIVAVVLYASPGRTLLRRVPGPSTSVLQPAHLGPVQ